MPAQVNTEEDKFIANLKQREYSYLQNISGAFLDKVRPRLNRDMEEGRIEYFVLLPEDVNFWSIYIKRKKGFE